MALKFHCEVHACVTDCYSFVLRFEDFIFDKHHYNVLEVNKTSYEKCNDQGFIRNITRGGRDVFQLTEARPYYFLSSGGYCYNGMRVAVYVEVEASETPAPAPAKNVSPPPRALNPMILSAIMTFVLAILLKPAVD